MRFSLLAFGGVAGALVAIAGCGGGDEEVPPNAVAVVGDTAISTAAYDRQLATVVKDDGAVGDPKHLRARVMEFLIQQEWVRRAADKVGVEVAPAEARAELARQKERAFATAKAYREFLRGSGRTEADVLEEVETALRQQKLGEKVTAGKLEVSRAEIQTYYAENKRSFGVAETSRPPLRTVRAKIVLTLKEKKRESALDAFATDFREEYRSQTVCATGFEVASCSNGPARNPMSPAPSRAQSERDG